MGCGRLDRSRRLALGMHRVGHYGLRSQRPARRKCRRSLRKSRNDENLPRRLGRRCPGNGSRGSMKFESIFNHVGEIELPPFSGTRVMMMPLIIGDPNSIPETLSHYVKCLSGLFALSDSKHKGQVGYFTIDEKYVSKGSTHRRAGLHVDGIYNGSCGSWGGGGGWGSVGNGMLTVSSIPGCKAYRQSFDGHLGMDGECDMIQHQCDENKSV